MEEAKPLRDLIPTTAEGIKNLALQKHESKELRTGDEKSFGLALKSKLIKECQLEEVKEVLRYVMIKVGLRAQNFPNDLEKLILFEHIAKYYGGHHLEEIKVAFDLAITGKLELQEGESAICYENFSCLYFSAIMNAYQKWAAEVHRTVIEPKKEKPEQRIFSEEELDNSARESVQMQYWAYVRGQEVIHPEANTEILTKDGLLKPEETVVQFYERMKIKGLAEIYRKQ